MSYIVSFSVFSEFIGRHTALWNEALDNLKEDFVSCIVKCVSAQKRRAR